MNRFLLVCGAIVFVCVGGIIDTVVHHNWKAESPKDVTEQNGIKISRRFKIEDSYDEPFFHLKVLTDQFTKKEYLVVCFDHSPAIISLDTMADR